MEYNTGSGNASLEDGNIKCSRKFPSLATKTAIRQ